MKDKKTCGEFVLAGGPMYGEKTGVITSQVKKIQLANGYGQNLTYALFKPKVDDRNGPYIVSRADGQKYPATFVNHPEQILESIDNKVNMVGIDELNFFEEGIVPVIHMLMQQGIDVYGAGLDLDFRGEPFGSMSELAALATQYIKTTAICAVCGGEARFTQRLLSNGEPAPYDAPLVVIEKVNADDGEEEYEPRCYDHHIVPGRENKKVLELYKNYLR